MGSLVVETAARVQGKYDLSPGLNNDEINSNFQDRCCNILWPSHLNYYIFLKKKSKQAPLPHYSQFKVTSRSKVLKDKGLRGPQYLRERMWENIAVYSEMFSKCGTRESVKESWDVREEHSYSYTTLCLPAYLAVLR